MKDLFERMFGRQNPSAGWAADPSVPLVVDLERCLFCGQPLGAPAERLAHLGPSDDGRVKPGSISLSYAARAHADAGVLGIFRRSAFRCVG